ncbi:MAG TPA: DUF721 domain-containing protein [Candidatus Paceibacterota bacterium]|nr:DUF721 domain-containing protein [Verrucomicrobiota bacterium]HOX03298.1 DUF721 domain-containing protein [Verrucomicrobiota bacterium]HRZ46203.1 DUF721 domain-containing protein [Candidatus Paceibacterota bacterium]
MSITPKSEAERRKAEDESRARVLAEWRGCDVRALEAASRRSERSIESVLPEVLRRARWDQRRTDVEIVKVWNEAVDPCIAGHAQPVRLVRGTLFVRVDHSVWLSEIVRYRRREILERLRQSFGRDLIQKISFHVG